jgi:DNA-binding transcriptional LysR family regulator
MLLSAPLRSFLEVAEQGSVSRAAERLGLTQPAVTKQLRALEAALDCSLVERAGRGIRLTRAGSLLAQSGRRGAAVFSDVAAALTELEQGESGRLVIGAGVTTSVLLLPPWLRELRRRYPGIDVSVRTGTSREVEAWVKEAEVDLGFVTSEPRQPELLVKSVFEEDIVLVLEPEARAKKTVGLDEVALILFPKSTGFRNYLEQRFAQSGLRANVKMETDSVEAIKSFVAVGLGASFLPSTTVQEELSRGQLVRARARGLGRLRRRTSLVRRHDRRPSFAVRAFLDVARPVAGASGAAFQ